MNVLVLGMTEWEAEWRGFSSSDSVVSEYYVALGSSPGASDVATWIHTGDSRLVRFSTSAVANGEDVYLTIQGKNEHGRSVFGGSPAVTTDLSYPVVTAMYLVRNESDVIKLQTGPSRFRTPRYQYSNTSLRVRVYVKEDYASIQACSMEITGQAKLTVPPSASNLSDTFDVQYQEGLSVFDFSFRNLSLPYGGSFYPNITVKTSVLRTRFIGQQIVYDPVLPGEQTQGLILTVTCYGMSVAEIIEVSPPKDPREAPGKLSIDYQSARHLVYGKFGEFEEKLAAVNESTCSYSIYSTFSDAIVHQWRRCDFKSRILEVSRGYKEHKWFENGDTLFLVMRLADLAGNWQELSSDGVMVDDTPPVCSCDRADPAYVNATPSTLYFSNCECVESESPMDYYVAIGTHPRATNVMGWKLAHTNRTYTFEAVPTFTIGFVYYVLVKGVNAAGVSSESILAASFVLDFDAANCGSMRQPIFFPDRPSILVDRLDTPYDPQSGLSAIRVDFGCSPSEWSTDANSTSEPFLPAGTTSTWELTDIVAKVLCSLSL